MPDGVRDPQVSAPVVRGEGELPAYFRFLERWDRYRAVMSLFMEGWDALLCPVEAFPAPAEGENPGQVFTYMAPFSLVGWPCAAVRGGTSPEGLPIGVQAVGKRWRDDFALAVALRVEKVFGGWRPPDLPL